MDHQKTPTICSCSGSPLSNIKTHCGPTSGKVCPPLPSAESAGAGRGGQGGARLPGWAWATAAAAVYHGSRCISSSLCLLHAGLGLRLVLGLGRTPARPPLAPVTVPSLSPPLALGVGLTLCWLSLHLSPSVGTKPAVRQVGMVGGQGGAAFGHRHPVEANVYSGELGPR